MADSFQELREAIQTGDQISVNALHLSETCQQRLIDALRAIGSRDEPGSGDIACLVRHVLRREDQQQGGQVDLRVPKRHPWPDRSTWQRSGITILGEGSDFYLINAQPWQPQWLECDGYPPDVPAFEELVRRNYESVPGDPFLSLVHLDRYRSVGQREAIHAVLTAPLGSTLVVNLPTGAGKSLCAQLPALLASPTGLSVVVVPTTALAIDQERALKALISHPTAYYGDESVEGKARRRSICDRIYSGTQRLIFTSPESLLSSLASAIYQAAQRGMLRYFVIDEAHMVEQWGDEFRPAFQEISGLRNNLLRLCSFRTLLLTATLTESCLDTLETLFGQPNFQVISAVQLRPEPSYWFSWCQEEIRNLRLLEAVYNLPRPLIIYGSKVVDVENWAKKLSHAGFKRFAVMTGKSSPEERLNLIQNWQKKRVDLVVATSAFGLGVDQSDVRAVIHVCIPETLDRFYQEVGRGGRDGKAAVSLTLHTTQDLEIAKSLNEKSTITLERGLQRWRSMFERKEITVEQKFRVPINVPPSLREKDIDMDSEQNRAWDIRTLMLMSRAGLIQMDFERPPQKRDFRSDEAYFQAQKSYRDFRLIKILDEYHLDEQTWLERVEPIRKQRHSWSYKNLQLMREALRAKRCLSAIFAEAYSIPIRETLPRKMIKVSRACGGCPFCRKHKIQPFAGIMPVEQPVWKEPHFLVGAELQRLLAGQKLMLIFYNSVEQRDWKQRRNRLFQWLIEQGIRNVVAPQDLRHTFTEEVEVNSISEAFIFFFEKYEPILTPHIPTLIFHPQKTLLPEKYLSKSRNFQAPIIILLPEDTPDPSRTDRLIINMFSGRSFRFDSLCREISL